MAWSQPVFPKAIRVNFLHNLRTPMVRLLRLALFGLAVFVGMAFSDQPDSAQLKDIGEEAFHEGDYTKALKLFYSLYEQAKTRKDEKTACEAAYRIGASYYSISAFGDAQKYLTEAYRHYPQSGLGEEVRLSILSAMAGVYFEEENYAKAREMASTLLREARQRGDSVLIAQNAQGLALIDNKEGKFSETHRHLQLARRYTRRGSFEDIHLLSVEAECYFLQHDFARTEQVCRRILAQAGAKTEDRSIALIYLIRALTERGAVHEAAALTAEARRLVSLRNLPLLCETLSRLERRGGQTDLAFAYMDSVVIFQDSLQTVSNLQLAEAARIKMEVMDYQAASEKQMARLRQNQIVAWLLAGICFLLVVMAVWFVRSQRQRARREKQLLALRLEREQQAKLLAEKQMKETELLARYQEEIMKRQLAEKQSELNATALFATARNALIEQVIETLNEADLPAELQPKVGALVQDLRQMVRADADSDKLIIDFEAANPDFVARLNRACETLSSSDIRFLSFVRMNLSVKEIAELMNITPESCKRRRQRVAKKLGLDSATELFDYILRF